MATKSNLISVLNGFITAIITQTKHRNANNAIVDEIYPNSVTDTHLTEIYTTKSGTDIGYSIRITKSGNIAHIRGTIENLTDDLAGVQTVFSWKENEFKMKTGIEKLTFNAMNGAQNVRVSLFNTGLTTESTLLPSTEYSFDFKTYITAD